MIQAIKAVEAHVGGQPLRLIIEGVSPAHGRTMIQKREWLRRQADSIRRAVVLEPRGHADMVAALLTEPISPEAHAGILFMDARGAPALSGHGIIAAATIAVAKNLFFSRDIVAQELRLTFDTPAGVIHTIVRSDRGTSHRRVHSVTFANVPSFVYAASQRVHVGTRELLVDVVFAGLFYAIVDAEATGIALAPERLHDLRRLGVDIQNALNALADFSHPAEPKLSGVAGVIFTGPPSDPEAHLRSVSVTGSVVDRSPGGIATAAVMTVLDAMGVLAEDQQFVHESITGTLFRGRAVRRTVVGEMSALIAEIEGSAWVTGEHTFLVDDDDPLRDGLNF